MQGKRIKAYRCFNKDRHVHANKIFGMVDADI